MYNIGGLTLLCVVCFGLLPCPVGVSIRSPTAALCDVDIGEFYSEFHHKCLPCDACQKGFGRDLNTVLRHTDDGQPLECYRCAPCLPGTHSEDGSDCMRCRRCYQLSRHVDQPCSSTQNTICGKCVQGFYDYYEIEEGFSDVIKPCRDCSLDTERVPGCIHNQLHNPPKTVIVVISVVVGLLVFCGLGVVISWCCSATRNQIGIAQTNATDDVSFLVDHTVKDTQHLLQTTGDDGIPDCGSRDNPIVMEHGADPAEPDQPECDQKLVDLRCEQLPADREDEQPLVDIECDQLLAGLEYKRPLTGQEREQPLADIEHEDLRTGVEREPPLADLLVYHKQLLTDREHKQPLAAERLEQPLADLDDEQLLTDCERKQPLADIEHEDLQTGLEREQSLANLDRKQLLTDRERKQPLAAERLEQPLADLDDEQLLTDCERKQPLADIEHEDLQTGLEREQSLANLDRKQLLTDRERKQPLAAERLEQPLADLDDEQLLTDCERKQPLAAEKREQPLPGLDHEHLQADRECKQPLAAEKRDQPLSDLDHEQLQADREFKQPMAAEKRDQPLNNGSFFPTQLRSLPSTNTDNIKAMSLSPSTLGSLSCDGTALAETTRECTREDLHRNTETHLTAIDTPSDEQTNRTEALNDSFQADTMITIEHLNIVKDSFSQKRVGELARRLGLNNADTQVDNLTAQYSGSELVYQVLLRWTQELGSSANLKLLTGALVDIGRTDIADRFDS